MNDDQPTQATVQVEWFDAYQVCPVVETTAPDGETICEAFHTLAEAQQHVNQFDAKDVFDGVEWQRILWTLYGLRKGIAEAIADCATEAEAFDLLFSITGITGTSGQTVSLARLSAVHLRVNRRIAGSPLTHRMGARQFDRRLHLVGHRAGTERQI